MNSKKKFLVQNRSFPDQLATDEEKESYDYGLRVGQSIQYEWFKKRGNSCQFYDRWEDYHNLRLYARGEQSVKKYKNELAIEGDLSMLNIDWTPLKTATKFVDIVVNGMSDRIFTVKAQSQDALSAEMKSAYQDMIEADMVAKEFLMQTKQDFGIDAFNVDPGMLPRNDQELKLHMQLDYKPSIEIAEESAIDTVFKMNKYHQIKKQLDYDSTVLGVCVAKHSFDGTSGIGLDYVDPAEVVHSYTEDPDYDDVFYWGEVKRIHLTELKKINPYLTEEDIKEIKATSNIWADEYSSMRRHDDTFGNNEIVNVLFFNYKTDKTFVWKEKILNNGGTRVIERDESFNPEITEDMMFRRVEKRIDVWYDGAMVLGSDKLLKWELSKNMVRPEAAFQKAYPNYIAYAPRSYKGKIMSLVEKMIPYIDMIQITHLKLQQVSSRVVPDGVYIDADGLNSINLGNGKAYNPHEALKLFFQTGSVIGRSYTEDGEYNHGKIPIQEINHSSGHNKIQSLINLYNYYLNGIRDVTGLNEARDGSTPDPDALVGVQKLAAANSNTATRHILDAGLDVTARLAECISLRISDILEYADFAEEFAMQIGQYNVAMLDEVKNLYLHSFGIFIDVSPDEEQKQLLEGNIQVALSRDQIGIDDVIEIRNQPNIKISNELLKLKKKDKEELDAMREQQKMEMQGKINAQSAQMAAQSKIEAINAETEAKIRLAQAESQFDIQKLHEEAALKAQLMDKEFQMNLVLKGEEAKNLKDRETYKEDRKDERTEKQATQQSKMIDQRQTGAMPIDFESKNDTLSGSFDLEGFEPR